MPAVRGCARGLFPRSEGECRSGADEPTDRVAGFPNFRRGLVSSQFCGVEDAVLEVVVEKADGDDLQCPGERADLGQDIDAVFLVVDHFGNTAGLPLNASHALEVLVFVADVTVS